MLYQAQPVVANVGRSIMSGYSSTLTVRLYDDDKTELERWLRCNKYPQGMCRRARIILLRAADIPIQAIARTIGTRRETVRKWIKRFRGGGIDALHDLPRSGRPPVFSPCSRNGTGTNRLRDAREAGEVTVFVGLHRTCPNTANPGCR